MDYSNNFIPRTFNSTPSSDFDFDDIVERDPSGRYVRYNEMLGKGAFKTVYKGFDEINGLEIAWNQVDIDELLETPQQLERLYSEINLLTRRLKHGNIIRCFHSWVDDENKTVNMITELFTSGNLRQYRKKHKYVDLKAIKNWARQILNGLQYLHTQTPCIIHRDLKCDNIFVNGNTGEVKIGDLGLAAVMQQPTARSVIGTPEFMAPELFDEEYNELVDIYAFGLCMLEMVTCEYPYSECKNPLQIYKRVTTGIKPAGLSRVKDEQLKAFIERCLVPASSRPSAEVLLSDPFLTSNAPPSRTSLSVMPSCPSILESGHPSKHEGHSMDIDHDGKKTDPCMDISSCSDAPQSSVWTLEYSNGIKTFNLIGALEDDHSISMTLRITSPNVAVKNVHFIYDLQQDTIASIAGEMEKELGEHDISKEDVMSVMQLMEQLIVELLPQNSPHGFSHGEVEGLFAKSGVTNLSSDGSGSVQDHGGAQESLNGECVVNHTQDPGCIEDLGSSGDGCLGVAKGCSVIDNELGLTSISSLTLVEKDCDSEELKQELDAIEFEYNQYFLELMQKKEELIECAKKKWSSRRASIF